MYIIHFIKLFVMVVKIFAQMLLLRFRLIAGIIKITENHCPMCRAKAVKRMKVSERIEELQTEITKLAEKYCDYCQEYSCEDCVMEEQE